MFRPTRGDAPRRFGDGARVAPPLPGGVVDAGVYRDPDRYEREREHVLRRSWLVAGRSSEIPHDGDWLLYEGHGETVVVSRQRDGSARAFHNVCQHRGARLTRGATAGCDRRFTCPWHGWVYDTTGELVGVPERDDFDDALLEGLRAPAVAVDEWGGWVWINLAGPDEAPALLDWIGPDIVADLGQFAMQDMVLHDKLVFDVDVSYKAVVDGFNEVYHATELHHTPPEFTKAARRTVFELSGPNAMMFVPRDAGLERLEASGDHHRHAICHYVVFPNTVFNNNPDQIQLFQPIPLAADRTRFVCWELIYGPSPDDEPGAYEAYLAKAMAHWAVLQQIVAEDVFVFGELAATRHSAGYRRNVLGHGEGKIAAYHATIDHCLAGGSPMDRWAR